jgi:hypothetical protein
MIVLILDAAALANDGTADDLLSMPPQKPHQG